MNRSFFLFVFLFPVHLFSQTTSEGLEFSRTQFNFPKQQNWVSRIDTIEVTNHTNKKIHLLKQNDPRGFEVRYPNRALEPGMTERIEIIFKPKETGKFNYSFPIYHSASPSPVSITYKGEILSFDEFAEEACPSFTKPNLKPVRFELEITVLDSSTKKPLSNSFIEISTGEFFSQHNTNAEGIYRQQAGINYYFILAEHTGYQGRSVAKHINPRNNKVTLELPRIIIAADPISTTSATPSLTYSTTVVTPVIKTASNTATFSLSEYKRNNIVFLIDKSSSMNKPDCMPLLQAAMNTLANITRPEDKITIITYANEARVVLPGTPGDEHEKITNVIGQLKCGGRTEGGKAIHTAYKNAEENFIKEGINQIIIATDGGFNGLSENETELMKLVEEYAQKGIQLSVLAFGQNRYGKAHIMRLAKNGGGFYEFIGTEEDAKIKLTETIRTLSVIR